MPICGNNVAHGSEVCDGSDLRGQTCQSQGFQYGNLRCSGSCNSYNTGSCSNQFCGNGIREGTEQCDGGACCTGSCTFAGGGTLCRGNAGVCDQAEYCTGSSASCPGNSFQSGTLCRGTAGSCDVAEYCSGGSPNCPGDAKLPYGTESSCPTCQQCDGTSNGCTNVPGPRDSSGSRQNSGNENDICYYGGTLNACYSLNTGGGWDEDNNQNSQRDGPDSACLPQCSTANCQAINGNYDSFACSGSTPGYLPGQWNQQNLGCYPGASCYCFACPGASTWNGGQGRCTEIGDAVCHNGVDDDQDGTTDVAGDADCSPYNRPPTTDSWSFSSTFEADTTVIYPYETVTFSWTISDDSAGITYTLNFGDGQQYGPRTGSTVVSDSIGHQYTAPGSYTATLIVTDTQGASDSRQAGITVQYNQGSRDGTPAPDPGSCQPSACYRSGSCFFDAGDPICFSDGQICVNDGNIYDRDDAEVYATVSSSTCSPVAWVDAGWCEDPSSSTGSTRCDTNVAAANLAAGATLVGFACGDDASEQYTEYTRFADYYDTPGTLHKGCLLNAAGCFGADASLSFHHYPGSEACADVDDDQDCDGYLPLYDQQCFAPVEGTVRVTRATGQTHAAYTADVSTERYPGSDDWLRIEADNDGGYAFPPLPFGARTVLAEWLTAVGNTTSFAMSPATAVSGADIHLHERVCNDDCTNNLGWCDRECFGLNGCPLYADLTAGQRAVMDASHPADSRQGKRFGTLVFVDQNETHRLVSTACISEPQWELAPKADVQGAVNNLIRYTRLVNYQGKAVRLVIASWN